ncbi:interleukin enhancer-binding factor 3-like [Ananas comosus]|uniref:Interleukin enhancer-binding factor 3-like n=1 Tax=Ananas comosus TaxID=4615 RepID=A0A6P5FI61_ANACO|nr:interleukin enhancer-binding factor 3-like [Ananas comosus]
MKRTINLFLLMAPLFLSITTFPATARDILDPARNPSNTHSASVARFSTDPAAEGFNVPGYGSWGNTGGYGSGYGGPGGGYARNGVAPPSVVCSEWGPCYMKRVTCPANCFTSYSHYGRNGGGGGGGGGCSIDCSKHCVGYC